jgi:hypothetical protein
MTQESGRSLARSPLYFYTIQFDFEFKLSILTFNIDQLSEESAPP